MFSTALWEKLRREKFQEKENRRKKILKQAKMDLARYFRNKRVSEVYLLGSILEPGRFSDLSDIDIAVSNLGEDYFKTFSDLEEFFSTNIDLIEMERCRFKERIYSQGLKIV